MGVLDTHLCFWGGRERIDPNLSKLSNVSKMIKSVAGYSFNSYRLSDIVSFNDVTKIRYFTSSSF